MDRKLQKLRRCIAKKTWTCQIHHNDDEGEILKLFLGRVRLIVFWNALVNISFSDPFPFMDM